MHRFNHEDNKLFKVDLSVIIIVNFIDDSVNRFLSSILSKALHHLANLFTRYRAISRLIENVKNFSVILDSFIW